MRPTPVAARAAERLPYLDNLKVAVIAAIIAIHAVLGYAGFMDLWSYTGLREVTLSPVVEPALLVAVTPFGFVLIPLLFLVAGLLTVPSIERKGPASFARDRLLRLGVPFAVYVGFVQPTVMYALQHSLGGAPGSFWQEYLWAERQLDTGPLWFVGVLLLFSLAYAGWAGVRAHRRRSLDATGVTGRPLLLIVAIAVPASVLVRLAYPFGSESGFTDLNLWEWPVCVGMFGLGVATARRGWLVTVPEPVRRRCRATALLALASMGGFLVLIGLRDMLDESMGGWHWQAVVFAVLEGTVAVFGSVWLLCLAQRHLGGQRPWAGPGVRRSAYGAFILQAPVLIGIAVMLRPLPLPAEAKAVLVAGGGVMCAFALARLLIRRVPLAARVL
jgi:heme/copper-type cytochrome/quinol oxidase subunit 4